MMERGDLGKYAVVAAIFLGLVGILLFFSGKPTGFAVFEDSGTGFDNGVYANTTYNGSAVVLSGNNLSGSYISEIFDAGNDAVWNNISYIFNTPSIAFLYAVDSAGDVYQSTDGITWIQQADNYGRTTDTVWMFSDSDSIYILTGTSKEVWKSVNNGVSWSVVCEGFTTSGLRVGASDFNNLYVLDSPGTVWKSTDSGVSWSNIGDFNGAATNDARGIAINSSNAIFVVDGTGDVYSSVNGGINWTKVNDGYGGTTGTDGLVVDSLNNLYILLNSDVYKSEDAGISWAKINDDFSPYANDGLVIGVDSDNIYIYDGIGRVFKSGDSGLTFSELGDFNAGASNDPRGFAALNKSSNLTFYARSCDDASCNGENWIAVTNPLNLGLSDNRYFQYKVEFTSPDSSISPGLISMIIDYSLVNTAPAITLVNPQDGNAYGYNESLALDFSVSDDDGNLDSCWYNIDDEGNISLADCANTTFDVSEGSHIINIYANDSLGLVSWDSASFSVVVGAPTISLSCPVNVFLSSGENIWFNYTPNDLDLDYCELWGNFDGEFKKSQTDDSPVSGEVNSFILNLSDGAYLWNIKCADDAGNSAFNGNKTFYVDTTPPNINLGEPKGVKTSRSVAASWAVSDASPVSCRYNVKRGESLEIANTSVSCYANSTAFNVTVDANFVFNFYVNDSAGNSNNANSGFSVDTSAPVSVPSSPGGSSGGSGGMLVNTTSLTTLLVSKIGSLIAYGGDRKTLSLNVKNTGRLFLNNCRLLAKGDISSWIYSDKKQGIAPGENVDFNFNLNIPEEIESGNYDGELEIRCDEGSSVQVLTVSIPGLSVIRIKNIEQNRNTMKITYEFDSSGIIGDSALVEIWITNQDNIEIRRMQDVFPINAIDKTERTVEIDVAGLSGIYSVYFALGDDLENFVRQSVALGKPGTTGFVIFDAPLGKGLIYLVFLVAIGIAVFFIWKSHGKKERGDHKWLLRKKANSR